MELGKFDKRAIVPIMMLMCIICLRAGLIPIWLLFMVMIGMGGILLAGGGKKT